MGLIRSDRTSSTGSGRYQLRGDKKMESWEKTVFVLFLVLALASYLLGERTGWTLSFIVAAVVLVLASKKRDKET